MKKSIPVALAVFSSFYILGLLCSIASIFIPFLIFVAIVVELISIIGTFISSIVMAVKVKHVDESIKGFMKGTSITAIVFSSIGIFITFISLFVLPLLSCICVVGNIVVFGLAIAAYVKYNKVYNTNFNEQISNEY